MPYLSPAQCFSSDFRRTTRLSVTRRIKCREFFKIVLRTEISSSCGVEMRSAISCALCRRKHQFQRQIMTVGAAERRNCWALMGAVVKKRRFRIDSRRYLRWNRREVRESTAGIEPRGEISHQESLRQSARNQEACAIPAPIPAAQESDVETTAANKESMGLGCVSRNAHLSS